MGKRCWRFGTNTTVYCSHSMSVWGVQMWAFAVGLFLVKINPDSLRLTATYGLVQGLCVLLLGPVIGDWVDRTPRYKAAQVTLAVQNLLVVLCAAMFFLFIEFHKMLIEAGEWSQYVGYAVIIGLSSAANLACMGNTIAVERDWVVEICGGREDKMASMTSTMRIIDQLCMILAPIATGAVLTLAGDALGALAIAAWNAVSYALEAWLLHRVYATVPQLQKRKDFVLADWQRVDGSVDDNSDTDDKPSEESLKFVMPEPEVTSCLDRTWRRLRVSVTAWRTYAAYRVSLSGAALAALYMTVMGFDNVTIGYAQIRGLSDTAIGMMQGGGGLFGILGALLFPRLRHHIGLPRAAMAGFTTLTTCLAACVISLWLKGGPFASESEDPIPSVATSPHDDLTAYMRRGGVGDLPGGGATVPPTTPPVSIYLFMSGLIMSRTGLWLADLAVTQMFLEAVKEQERGVVNGVQSSFNQLMNFVKFALVTALPRAPQFGWLVLLSYMFILTGTSLHAAFLCRSPGKSGGNNNIIYHAEIPGIAAWNEDFPQPADKHLLKSSARPAKNDHKMLLFPT